MSRSSVPRRRGVVSRGMSLLQTIDTRKGLGRGLVSEFYRRGWVDRWTGGPVDRWTGGPVDRWTGGPVDRWTGGPVERWNGGTVERWNGGTVERSAGASRP